jgi:hypothetical protein
MLLERQKPIKIVAVNPEETRAETGGKLVHEGGELIN